MQIHIIFRGHSKSTLALRLIIYKGKKVCSLVLPNLRIILYNVEIRGTASVFAVPPLALDVSGTFQVIERPLHRARREMQVVGDGFHARPAASAACTVTEVHIDRSRPVRQVGIGVDFTEEAHFSP